jgi:glycosyltransferase involved in cell wall biosynthesis
MPVLSKKPLVSIIITSYNRGNFIDKAITSSLSQDYANLEIIVSDNCSTDNTAAILERYAKEQRVKVFVNNTNIGMLPNFKLATERTSGKYITYLSSDDYFCNDQFISQAVELINKYEDVVLVAAKNATLFEDINKIVENEDHIINKEFIKGTDLFLQFPQYFAPGWGAVLTDRNKILATNIFESKAQSIDYEANLKLMLQGNVAFINQVSYVWRKHVSNASGFITFQIQKDSFDFIDNTCNFSKQIKGHTINIEKWKRKVYYAHLNAIVRRLINNKSEVNRIIDYVKKERKVKVTFFHSPKYFFLFLVYKNYTWVKTYLKILHPKLYHSLQGDIQ